MALKSSLNNVFLRFAAIVVLSVTYGGVALFCKIFKRKHGQNWRRRGNFLVVGTFHNPNWFHSHITPLTLCGRGEVLLVCDEPQDPLEGVRYFCPPRCLSKLLTRAGAKFVMVILSSIRFRPDLYMAYHIFPSGVIALMAARMFNRPASYQVVSGPLELEGGGWRSENRLLASLGGPSVLVERLVFSTVRAFDSIVVRGSGANAYINAIGCPGKTVVITGSVKEQDIWLDLDARDIDVAFVGRLSHLKGPDRFIVIAALVAKRFSKLRVAVVGEGPEREIMEAQAKALGIAGNITFYGKRKDVPVLLERTRVFLLTSRWEGLSIAMLEAMACGAVPVVSDVGDLRDLVDDGKCGYVVAGDDHTAFCKRITDLLSDEVKWRRLSLEAKSKAENYSGLEAVTRKWSDHLGEVIGMAGARDV